jgi:uncharacterized protein YecE (DUF72 family)
VVCFCSAIPVYFSNALDSRFSKARFERDCLNEYGEVFHTVSGDFAFYQFPTDSFWKGLFSQVPADFQFAFKAPEEVTTPAFPRHPRYGTRAGQGNPLFLDATAFIAQFLRPFERYASSVGVIMFEFPAALMNAFNDIGALCDDLNRFFDQLPRTFRYAVEIRSKYLFCEVYFRTLRDQGIAHVFNSWTEMPSIQEQMTEPDVFTAGFTVSRALMKPGRTYEQSVALFAPYESVREPNADVRKALRDLLVRSKNRGESTFIYVNNRLEGFAPGTIASLVDAD